ncbi:MAG: CoA-binding protein [Dehalococcoidales bacterium]|nr:MAG: CoA-binding protein [Dehalococcoidales bacterium]
MQNNIDEFMKQKIFAIVGATDNTEKFGYKIFKNLKDRGYEVYPVNPKLETLDGIPVYHTLLDIPVKVDVVDFVVPPTVTEEILKDCHKLGLKRIWLQPGAESEDAIKYCNDNGMTVLYDV